MFKLPSGVDDDSLRFVFGKLLQGLEGQPDATRCQVASMIGMIGWSITGGGEPDRLEMMYQMGKVCFGRDHPTVQSIKMLKEKGRAEEN